MPGMMLIFICESVLGDHLKTTEPISLVGWIKNEDVIFLCQEKKKKGKIATSVTDATVQAIEVKMSCRTKSYSESLYIYKISQASCFWENSIHNL